MLERKGTSEASIFERSRALTVVLRMVLQTMRPKESSAMAPMTLRPH